jgi:transglutaminase-like putative cysteine protease
VPHSVDAGHDAVTCAASEVLRERTGFCYAKSHLLVALLRANSLPAGLCYQRLTLDPPEAPEAPAAHGETYCLHGLVAVHLPDTGWYRMDPRGNKPGVDAQFTPPRERLAFEVARPGECLFPEVYARPWPVVVSALQSHRTAGELLAHLPDVPNGADPRNEADGAVATLPVFTS